MKTNKPASGTSATKVANITAAKAAEHSARQKAETTRKVASLAKGRYKVAKKSYKLARKAAKRAAKEAKRAHKRLEACLAQAAKRKKRKSPAPKTTSKPVKLPAQRKVISKQLARKQPALVIKTVSTPEPPMVPILAPANSSTPPTDSE